MLGISNADQIKVRKSNDQDATHQPYQSPCLSEEASSNAKDALNSLWVSMNLRYVSSMGGSRHERMNDLCSHVNATSNSSAEMTGSPYSTPYLSINSTPSLEDSHLFSCYQSIRSTDLWTQNDQTKALHCPEEACRKSLSASDMSCPRLRVAVQESWKPDSRENSHGDHCGQSQ